MTLDDVTKLLDAGFTVPFIERLLAPAPTPAPEQTPTPAPEQTPTPAPAPEPTPTPAPESTPAPGNPELAEISRKMAELLGAVQQHNILTITQPTPAKTSEEITADYLSAYINPPKGDHN